MTCLSPIRACVVLFGLASALLSLSGCMVPATQLKSCQTQNQNLSERCRALSVELENLKVHARRKEDELVRSERRLAKLEEELGVDADEVADLDRRRDRLQSRYAELANRFGRLPADVARRLQELSADEESLQFDPATGLAKFDADILFDTGEADLKPDACKVLARLADVLASPEAENLRLMVVGHTDDRGIAGRPIREKYPSNFHLSTARANAVAEYLQEKGLKPQRLGVAGFGAHQPIAPNGTPRDRRKNRRVEIFVMAPDVPVVGWTETIPSSYR